MAQHDLAIRWANGSRSLQRIRRLKGVPLHGFPHHLRCPGGQVAIVQRDGEISLIFEACKIDGQRRVQRADGKVQGDGVIVRAKQGTLRSPGRNDPKQLGIRWRAIGQFRYFDAKTGNAVIVGDDFRRTDDDYLDEHPTPQLHRRPYVGGIPGVERNHPEAQLVDEYVAWINAPERFDHRYLPGPRLFTDLFDGRYWRLIEAKANIERRTLRTAVGQLLDYKRFFSRKPSLGVLVPARPSDACLEYLASCKVTAIWRTPRGRFGDSSEGRLWSQPAF